MKKFAILLTGLFLMTVVINTVSAQTNSATDNDATAAANIIAPITVAQTTGLDFGNIIPATTAGTVVMTTGNVRTSTGDVTLQPAVPGQSAVFNVTGLEDALYSISLPADNTVSLTGTGDPMFLTGFNHSAGATPQITGGNVNFSVGATLNVNASQAAGQYNGTYEVTVTYN